MTGRVPVVGEAAVCVWTEAGGAPVCEELRAGVWVNVGVLVVDVGIPVDVFTVEQVVSGVMTVMVRGNVY